MGSFFVVWNFGAALYVATGYLDVSVAVTIIRYTVGDGRPIPILNPLHSLVDLSHPMVSYPMKFGKLYDKITNNKVILIF